jgi:nicotinic acid phosphoribosyltransferase
LLGCSESFLRPLIGLRFTGDVLAVPEGRIVLADEPLVEVTVPLPHCAPLDPTHPSAGSAAIKSQGAG